jgi:hypothetical protein
MRSSVIHRSIVPPLLLLSIATSAAAAQSSDPDRQPIGRFAADARGVFVSYPKDPGLAAFLEVTEDNLATRGLGAVVGVHAYPVRLGQYVALGLGGELLFSRGGKTLAPPDDKTATKFPTVNARLSAVSPQFSLNFGGRDGWSYLSGGIGWTKFTSELKTETPTTTSPVEQDTPRTSTINYGGGARWFMKRHLAFTLDLRFYAIRPQTATATRPSLKRSRLITLGAGVSFR